MFLACDCYKQLLLSDSMSVSDSACDDVCLSAARISSFAVASHVAYRLVFYLFSRFHFDRPLPPGEAETNCTVFAMRLVRQY